VEKEMNELNREIARLEAAIAQFDALIPASEGLARRTFVTHRRWDSEILSNLHRLKAHAA
jgi:hypothetical protein